MDFSLTFPQYVSRIYLLMLQNYEWLGNVREKGFFLDRNEGENIKVYKWFDSYSEVKMPLGHSGIIYVAQTALFSINTGEKANFAPASYLVFRVPLHSANS